MTTLTISFYRTDHRIRQWFGAVNQGGRVTFAFGILCAGAVLLYLGLLFWMTQMGFVLEKQERERIELQEMALRFEFSAREGVGAFPLAQKDALRFMEPVTAITYLLPDNVAVSRAVFQP